MRSGLPYMRVCRWSTRRRRVSMLFKAGKEERGKRRENSGKNPLYLSFKYSVVERLSEFFFEKTLRRGMFSII